MKWILVVAAAMSAMTALVACKGDNDSAIDVDKELQGSVQLEQYLKKGFINSYQPNSGETDAIYTLEVDTAADASTTGASTRSDVSTTNVQEAGVDEADQVKQNGEYLYAINPRYKDPTAFYTDGPGGRFGGPGVEIHKTHSNPVDSEHVGSYPLVNDSNNLQSVRGLYLLENQLVVMGNSYNGSQQPSTTNEHRSFYVPWHWQSYSTSMQFLDLSDPQSPVQQMQIQIEGNLVSSRRIGNYLYLASKFTPQINIPNEQNITDRNWKRQVLDMPLTNLLPRYWKDGELQGHLFTDGDCHLPDYLNAGGYPSLVTLARIDLTNPDDWQVKCTSGRIDGVYASSDAFYLTGNYYAGKSRIDQYSLAEFDLVASTKIAGHLGWNSPSFRLSENDGYLRVLTSSRNDFFIGITDNNSDVSALTVMPDPEWKHRLHILKPNDEKGFDQIAILPNEQKPQVIGKPGEDVKSVRFRGDRGYVVTFRQTDPLYVLNLSEPENPFIEGALEIEGFSAYLEPLADNLLLGFGQAANANGQIQGLKLSLFDIENPAAPTEITSYRLGGRGSYAQALWDHHAISFLAFDEDKVRMAFTWRESEEWDWLGNKVHIVDIDKTSKGMQVQADHYYKMPGENQYYSYETYTRVPLQADGLHLVVDGAVTSGPVSDWQNDTELVYINDGAIQCESQGMSEQKTAKLLTDEGIEVASSQCGYLSGVAIAAMCGLGDSNINLHTIDVSKLVQAKSLGFESVSTLKLNDDKGFKTIECAE